MATYQDYQTLANKIYDFGKLDKDGNDVTNIVSYEDINKKTVTWTKILEQNNPSTGYYGAVYQNGSEYILVNTGTQLSNFTDLTDDAQMFIDKQVPDQYIDAKALMERTQDYIATHSGGTFSITGHSLGGSLSQMLAVEYGPTTVTVNPFNTQVLLDNMNSQNDDFAALREESTSIQSHIAALKDAYGGTTLEEAVAVKIEALQKQQQGISSILNGENLLNHYQVGQDYNNINNYLISNDPVSSEIQLKQFGESITITLGDVPAYLNGINIGDIAAQNGSELGELIGDFLRLHGSGHFAIDELQNSGLNLYVSSNQGEDSQIVQKFLDNFKDSKTYELDRVAGDIVRVSQNYELYFMPSGAASKPANAELIGELYDPSYQQAVFAKAANR